MAPKLPPRRLPGFPDAKRVRPKTPFQGGRRARWRDSRGLIYEWDYENGTVERYSKSGRKHHGEFDPQTGERRKGPQRGRRVQP
jgi:hypothetical protein